MKYMNEYGISKTIAAIIAALLFIGMIACIILILHTITSYLKRKFKSIKNQWNNPGNTEPLPKTNTVIPEQYNNLENTEYYPYKKKMLLSKAEYAFYNILKRKCDENNLLICPKVRMEDFIDVTDKKNKLKYRGYIKSRHIDFMICDSRLHLLAGIELDDNFHKNADIIKTDTLKNNIFLAIQLPLFRVRMSEGMYEKQIDNIITSLKQINTPSMQFSPTDLPDIKI